MRVHINKACLLADIRKIKNGLLIKRSTAHSTYIIRRETTMHAQPGQTKNYVDGKKVNNYAYNLYTRCKYFDPCYSRATVVRARFLAAAFSDGSYLAHVNGAYLRHVTFCIVRGPPLFVVSPISQRPAAH